MGSILKREFQMKNFGFNFYREDVMYTAQWRWHPAVFVLFRIALGAYLLAYCLYSLVVDYHGKYFIFLTNLTYVFETIAFVVAAVVAIIGYFKNRREDRLAPVMEMNGAANGQAPKTPDRNGAANGQAPKTPDVEKGAKTAGEELPELKLAWYLKLSWLLSSMADILALVVTLSYWGALFPVSNNKTVDFDNAQKHALNGVVVLLDAAISARPTRILHSVYSIAYGLVYMVFSIAYWGFDNENNVIYKILDWNSPGIASAVILGIVFALIPLLSLFRFGIYRLRLCVFEKIYKEPY